MEYKYKRWQLFGKRLNVPKNILNDVYNSRLSCADFFKYKLDDKIPLSCLWPYDKKIIDKFGIDKCKNLDWELIGQRYISELMSIDSKTKDLNRALCEILKDKIIPAQYSLKMKELYPNRIIDINQDDNENIKVIKESFNYGNLTLTTIVSNWELFKNKNLSFCLSRDINNKCYNITSDVLKKFMIRYSGLAPLIIENNDIYKFIDDLNNISLEIDKEKYIKYFTDDILNEVEKYKLTNKQYKEIFKYSSLDDYLSKANSWYSKKLIEELELLPKNYIFDSNILLPELLNDGVLNFIYKYGLKNIIDFDKGNNNFFTDDNCKRLKSIYYNYICYDTPKIITSFSLDKDFDSKYTKDEFYEVMRRIMVYGPNQIDIPIDYRYITGEFKNRYPELFLDKEAPIELQDLFYTKTLTGDILKKNPSYLSYLNGKNLSTCFSKKYVLVSDSKDINYNNFYDFITTNNDFNSIVNFIIEYRDILDIVLKQDEIVFSINDDISQIKKKINNSLINIIVKKGIKYPKYIPQEIKDTYPSLFLDERAPEELKTMFYNRTISSEYLLSNPDYIKYLKNIDLEVVFKGIPIANNTNLITIMKDVFNKNEYFGEMLLYHKYIEKIYDKDKVLPLNIKSNFSREDLLNELDKIILKNIIDGNLKYDEKSPSHFKKMNSTLFLDDSVSEKIKNSFYNREFTVKDFYDNPELFKICNNINIACGFPQNMSWIIPLFSDNENFELANYRRMKVISAFSKIQDKEFENVFKEYVMEFKTDIDLEKLEDFSKLLSRFSLSNSSEIFAFRKELLFEILNSNEPLKIFDKIEEVFIKNNLPTVGKIYSCFKILHPDFQGFDYANSTISPILKNTSLKGKELIVFSDLIKATFGSNNKSVNDYLKNIELGSKLYERIKFQKITFDSIDEEEKNELLLFSKHLATLYNNTLKAKLQNKVFKSSKDVVNDIFELSKELSPDGTLNYNLGDRVIRMFCGSIGINTLEEPKKYMEKKIKTADLRNRIASSSDMNLEKGDFIKGIGGIQYLRNILQNGSVSNEYLGSSAGSDSTPLDTDVSMIMSKDKNIDAKIHEVAARNYGPIWFVLKNDDRFVTTRTSTEEKEIKKDFSKLEVFYTGVCGKDHYGIRTGFASSEINYILMENFDKRVGLEIAMNGFYIPVADKNGKIIFTPKDYDELREKMSGLSYYDENNYNFSRNLVTEETINLVNQIEKSNYETKLKKEKLNDIFKKSLEELGLKLKTTIDGDLTEGYVELIDTGSTGRGTNKPQDGDFDFMMRIDKNILLDSLKLDKLKKSILKNLGKENSIEVTGSGDFRLKSVKIGDDTNVDVDITFVEKTDKVLYSTDMSLIDRLSTIKKIDKEKYKYVVANILHAKQVLKEAEAYKPNRGENPQGGLGGVGIENWILQNGGSFIDAAKSFIEKADGKDFFEFKENYQIWDFGDNHLAEIRGQYRHDNFVANNMSEAGYKKMVKALKKYLKDKENNQILTSAIKR